MTERRLSEAAEQFLHDSTGSMLHLDILLLLRRDVQRWFIPVALAAALRVSVDSAERALEQLGAANLIDVKIGNSLAYRFAPIDDGVRPVIDEIATLHYENRQALEAAPARRCGAAAARLYNALNDVFYNNTNLDPNSSNFGKVSSQNNLPRNIQVAMKIVF